MHPFPAGQLGLVVSLTLLQVSPSAKMQPKRIFGRDQQEFPVRMAAAPVLPCEPVCAESGSSKMRHAYGWARVAPLCRASIWSELAPASETTCPECLRMQGEQAAQSAVRRTVSFAV